MDSRDIPSTSVQLVWAREKFWGYNLLDDLLFIHVGPESERDACSYTSYGESILIYCKTWNFRVEEIFASFAVNRKNLHSVVVCHRLLPTYNMLITCCHPTKNTINQVYNGHVKELKPWKYIHLALWHSPMMWTELEQTLSNIKSCRVLPGRIKCLFFTRCGVEVMLNTWLQLQVALHKLFNKTVWLWILPE